jgi:NADPH:quinone reductase-like Zn-dependent oxidoreductase
VDKRRLHKAPTPSESLNLDQISLLPLCGIPAYRAVAALRAIPISSQSDVLILDAHKGTGVLIQQQVNLTGVDAAVHLSSTAILNPSVDFQTTPTTIFGDSLAQIRKMKGSSLDAIIDTIGGRDLWEECCRVLRNNGSVRTRRILYKLTHFILVHHNSWGVRKCASIEN